MNRFLLSAAGLFAAFFLFTNPASAACPDSPKVKNAAQKNQAKLLEACKVAGIKMHNICDTVPTCTNAETKSALQAKVKQAQKCIDARRNITREWYEGAGDAGHDGAVDGKVNQANNCILLLSRK